MRRYWMLTMLAGFTAVNAPCQSFTIDDLLTLSSHSRSGAGKFMNKKRFSPTSHNDEYLHTTRFFEKGKLKDTSVFRTVDIIRQDNKSFFAFHTSSEKEFIKGKEKLIQAGFFYDTSKDFSTESVLLFQKRNITIKTKTEDSDEGRLYTFILEKKEFPLPGTMRFADGLLQFDSHEFLSAYFGSANVKKDLYYFSKKELRKCTVLFPNSSRQALFVWKDEQNLCGLAYILIGGIIPVKSAENFDRPIINNQWLLENGIHSGMSLRELLQLNENDFEFYGNRSELAFIVSPQSRGKIDFRRTAVVLNCSNCNTNIFFNKELVKATEVAEEHLPLYVHDIILSPVQGNNN